MSYGENYITPCSACYSYTLPGCTEATNITIKGALGNDIELDWYVEDKFGKVYHDTATTNADGDIEIPIASFPDGFFNPFTGELTIYFKEDEGDTEVVEMTFNELPYECIKLAIADLESSNMTIE